jgi:hypothetical protein
MIAASVVLTHQHHLLDALMGYLLALSMVKMASRLPVKDAH